MAGMVADHGPSEAAGQIWLAAGAGHERPRFLNSVLDRMDHVAQQAFALRDAFHHGPKIGREVIEARIEAGKRYFADRAVILAVLVDLKTPRPGLQFAAAHQLMDDVMGIAQGSFAIRQRDAACILKPATSVSQFECVSRHRLNLPISAARRSLASAITHPLGYDVREIPRTVQRSSQLSLCDNRQPK